LALEALVTRRDERLAVHRLVQKLASTRLLTTDREPGRSELVEITHDSLLLAWSTLSGWILQQRTFLVWRQRLPSDTSRWMQLNRDPGALLRGAALAEASHLRILHETELTEDERAFINSSEQQHEEEENHRREQETALAEARRQRLEESERLRRAAE